MKKTYENDHPKKKSIAAANHFQSSQSMQPPSFASATTMTENTPNAAESQATEGNQQEDHDQSMESELEGNAPPQNTATIKPHKLFSSVVQGHQLFKQGSVLSNVKVNGAKATGATGCLSAPDVRSYIYAELFSEFDTQENIEMAKAISKVLGRFINQWRAGFHIPGIMWFPMFEYFPGPFAPPMPNTPTPLAQTPSLYELFLTHKQNMIMEIFHELPNEMDNDINRNTVEIFSEKTVNYFNSWLNNSYMLDLIGYGPIPSFSPPFRFGGKVQNGQVVPKASVLS